MGVQIMFIMKEKTTPSVNVNNVFTQVPFLKHTWALIFTK
jgi:hypothetical protein